MIGSLLDLLFACKHRRTTFPFTPVKRKDAEGREEPPGATYVVCLECGKQFAYDWEKMQLGKPVDISEASPAHEIDTAPIPFRTKSRIKYLAWGSMLSAVLVLGKVAQSRHRSHKSTTAGQNNGQSSEIEDPQNPRTPEA